MRESLIAEGLIKQDGRITDAGNAWIDKELARLRQQLKRRDTRR